MKNKMLKSKLMWVFFSQNVSIDASLLLFKIILEKLNNGYIWHAENFKVLIHGIMSD